MDVARIHLDWASLEVAPGRYNEEELREQLEKFAELGLSPMLSIYTVDSEGYVLPDDLLIDGLTIVDGMSIDDPAIVSRYKALLDWAVPMAQEYGVWAITIANEPGFPAEDLPEQKASFVNFWRAARDHIHALDDELPVTVTIAADTVANQPAFAASVLEIVDVACFNYYAVGQDTVEETLIDVQADMTALLAAADGKHVIFQELGSYSGYAENSRVGSSEQKQANFFDAAFQIIRSTERLRAAFVFQLHDPSPEVGALYTDLLRQEGIDEDFILSFEEKLLTIGLIRFEDGRHKLALEKFMEAL
jgi:hypothetical protein